MSTGRALWPALKPLILLLQDSFTMSRRMEKLQGLRAQDAALLESFGWAPGNVWWQRKMKVLERKKTKKRKISRALIPPSPCCCELGMSLEHGKDRKPAFDTARLRVSVGCIKSSFCSALLNFLYAMKISHLMACKTKKTAFLLVVGLITQFRCGFPGV